MFHWSIVLLFGFSWWTADTDRLDWHMWSGYAILTLVLFRIYWGFAGSRTARFAHFLKGPKAFLAYSSRLFARPASGAIGHNPMGGWSVAAFIALLLLQTGLGLFAIDVDGLNGGPLDNLVSFETGRRASGLHDRVFNLLLVLIGLHLVAIMFYWVYKRENLIGAMIRGWRRMPPSADRGLYFVPVWWAIPGLAAAAAIVAALVLVHF